MHTAYLHTYDQLFIYYVYAYSGKSIKKPLYAFVDI